jgi:hypothetical protein
MTKKGEPELTVVGLVRACVRGRDWRLAGMSEQPGEVGLLTSGPYAGEESVLDPPRLATDSPRISPYLVGK